MTSGATLLMSHARKQVLWTHVEDLLGANSNTIWSHRCSGNGPRRSTPALIANIRNSSDPRFERVETGWKRFGIVTQSTHWFHFHARLECSQTIDETVFEFSSVEFSVVVCFPAEIGSVIVDVINCVFLWEANVGFAVECAVSSAFAVNLKKINVFLKIWIFYEI